jgi:hypothetical protein
MCKNITELDNKHFDYFQVICRQWISKFGLFNWRYTFAFIDKNPDFRATINSDVSAKIAVIELEQFWNGNLTYDEIYKELEYIALHEILHSVFAQMLSTAQTHPNDYELLERDEHGVIMRLTNLIMDGG